jgi:hypothetical protein
MVGSRTIAAPTRRRQACLLLLGWAVTWPLFQVHASEVLALGITKGSLMQAHSEKPEVQELLSLRDDAFEKRRLELFAKPNFADQLRAARCNADAADVFAIGVLLTWLVDNPANFTALERFIVVEEPALKKANRTAAGSDGSTNLLRELGQQKYLQSSLDYLLLRALTRPHAQPYVHGALGRYFSQKPIHEPEVWLRMTLEINDEEVARHTAEQVLALADRTRALKALNTERTRLAARRGGLPSALEAMRAQLSSGK